MVRSKSEDLLIKPEEEVETDWPQFEPQPSAYRAKRRYSRTSKDISKQPRPSHTPAINDSHRHSYSEEPNFPVELQSSRLPAAFPGFHQSPKNFRSGSAMSLTHPREILVDIPPYSNFPIPSMLTPESSPDSRKSYEPPARLAPDPPALTRPVDETLPEIEPQSLEDYLRTVESDEHLSLTKRLRRVQSQPAVELLAWDTNLTTKVRGVARDDSVRSDASESSGTDSPLPLERQYFTSGHQFLEANGNCQTVAIPVFTQVSVRSHYDNEPFIGAHQYDKGNFRRMSRTLANVVPYWQPFVPVQIWSGTNSSAFLAIIMVKGFLWSITQLTT